MVERVKDLQNLIAEKAKKEGVSVTKLMREIASTVGVSERTLWRYVQGDIKNPSLDHIDRLASVLGVTYHEAIRASAESYRLACRKTVIGDYEILPEDMPHLHELMRQKGVDIKDALMLLLQERIRHEKARN